MLTEIELHNKRMYKKSIRHTIKKGFTPVRVKDSITIKPTFDFEPIPVMPSKFENWKSRVKGIFTRRKP